MVKHSEMMKELEQVAACQLDAEQAATEIADRIANDLAVALGCGDILVSQGWDEAPGQAGSHKFKLKIPMFERRQLVLKCELTVQPDNDIRNPAWKFRALPLNTETNDYGEPESVPFEWMTENTGAHTDVRLSHKGLDCLSHHIYIELKWWLRTAYPLGVSYNRVLAQCASNVRP